MLYQVPCAHSPHCVSPGQLCDGVTQCPDGSDEDPNVCGKSHIPYSVPSARGLAGWGLTLPQALATTDWPILWQFGAQLDCGWSYQRLSDWFGLVSFIFIMKSALEYFFFLSFFFSVGIWESRKESLVCSQHLGKRKQEWVVAEAMRVGL